MSKEIKEFIDELCDLLDGLIFQHCSDNFILNHNFLSANSDVFDFFKLKNGMNQLQATELINKKRDFITSVLEKSNG